jgi:hypothetical protein
MWVLWGREILVPKWNRTPGLQFVALTTRLRRCPIVCSLSGLYENVSVLLVFYRRSVSYCRLTTEHANILNICCVRLPIWRAVASKYYSFIFSGLIRIPIHSFLNYTRKHLSVDEIRSVLSSLLREAVGIFCVLWMISSYLLRGTVSCIYFLGRACFLVHFHQYISSPFLYKKGTHGYNS